MSNAWAMLPVRPVLVTSAAGAAAGYAVANMLNDHMGVVFKSAGTTSDYLYVDLGPSPPPIDSALFFGCTGALASWQLQVQASDDAGVSVNVVTYPTATFLAGSVFPTHGRGVGYWENSGAAVVRRYWRFTFVGIAGAQITIGRLAMGARLRLARNFGFGAAFGVRDFGRMDFSANAAMLRRKAPKLRVCSVTFPHVHKDEVEEKVQPLQELAGGQEPIVLVTDPEAHAQRQRRCWFGPLTGDLGTIWPRPSGWEWRANLIDLVQIPKAAG